MAVAVLGILLAVAVPLYNDYQTRARVAQVLTAIDTLRTVFHAEYEVEGGIPKFAPGKEGEIPPELARLPIGPELLRFDFLSESLIQSSHHYGPFEGKDIPYLVLKANDALQTRYLKALEHALPHSSYAWLVEPMVMIVPLLDARARHDSVVNTKQNPSPAQVAAQPKPLACGSGQERVTIPAGLSPSGTSFNACANSCGPGQVRDQNNPLSCVAPAQTAQAPSPNTPTTCPPTGEPAKTELVNGSCVVPCPSGLVRGNDGRCHSFAGPAQPAPQNQNAGSQGTTASTQTASTGGAQNSRQQYDQCRAHVLADHPHGHAWGLLKQCDRYLH